MILEQFKRLIDIYDSEIANINSILRINFTYNTVNSFILYQNTPELKYSFCICWFINNTYFIQQFYVKKTKKGEYYLKPFLDSIIHKNLKDKFKGKTPMIDYFKYIFDNLDNNLHIREPKEQINQYTVNMPKNCIFFHHFARKNMSTDMEKKLKKLYDDDFLISQIQKQNQTAVFSNNIFDARDIYIEYSLRFK
ncbi:MAG: hypothetical protein ACRC1R_00875 [Cetobacterium sp.]|uniref:hypothetical protein n=1 Tax=Cetobacterium sp. TaxID=2071632 RepID=UPI003F33CE67